MKKNRILREYFKIDQNTVSMAVLCHRSFPNGVIITKNLLEIIEEDLLNNVQYGEKNPPN